MGWNERNCCSVHVIECDSSNNAAVRIYNQVTDWAALLYFCNIRMPQANHGAARFSCLRHSSQSGVRSGCRVTAVRFCTGADYINTNSFHKNAENPATQLKFPCMKSADPRLISDLDSRWLSCQDDASLQDHAKCRSKIQLRERYKRVRQTRRTIYTESPTPADRSGVCV